jgi:5-formyltetrahydrofolate cyclo-ligase
MLGHRRALAPTAVRRASRLVQQAFITTEEFVRAKVVALYAAIQNEVETAQVLQVALAWDKVVLFPVVCSNGLEFRRLNDPAALRKGAFAIPEPDATCPPHSAEEADLIVLPGVAFDLCGRRIGYGKGYYDRALHRLEGDGRLVGFCYDFQLVDEIAEEPHDVKMDMIITESRVVRPRNRPGGVDGLA